MYKAFRVAYTSSTYLHLDIYQYWHNYNYVYILHFAKIPLWSSKRSAEAMSILLAISYKIYLRFIEISLNNKWHNVKATINTVHVFNSWWTKLATKQKRNQLTIDIKADLFSRCVLNTDFVHKVAICYDEVSDCKTVVCD